METLSSTSEQPFNDHVPFKTTHAPMPPTLDPSPVPVWATAMLKRPPAMPQHPQRSSALLLISALAPTPPFNSLLILTDAPRTPSRLSTRLISTTDPRSTSKSSRVLSANNCKTSARPRPLPSQLAPPPRLLPVCSTSHISTSLPDTNKLIDAATGQAAADAFNSALGVSAA